MKLKKFFVWGSLAMIMTLAMTLLAGCGQTGPLYLPKPQTAQTTPLAHAATKSQVQTKDAH